MNFFYNLMSQCMFDGKNIMWDMTNENERGEISSWEIAQKALRVRPEEPEGYFEGRPYFFLPVPLAKYPDAGYHVWFDEDLPDIVVKEDNDREFLVPWNISLQIRGGLAKMLSNAMGMQASSVEEVHTKITVNSVTGLLRQVAPQLLRGANWVDVGSGCGAVASEACAAFGVKELVHIDPLPVNHQRFLQDIETRPDPITRSFIPGEIQHIRASDLPNPPYSGMLLVHPNSDRGMFDGTFSLAKSLQRDDFAVVTLADSEDVRQITNHARDHGFDGSWQELDPGGNGAIFRPIK
jgi:hypothetical protein